MEPVIGSKIFWNTNFLALKFAPVVNDAYNVFGGKLVLIYILGGNEHVTCSYDLNPIFGWGADVD